MNRARDCQARAPGSAEALSTGLEHVSLLLTMTSTWALQLGPGKKPAEVTAESTAMVVCWKGHCRLLFSRFPSSHARGRRHGEGCGWRAMVGGGD